MHRRSRPRRPLPAPAGRPIRAFARQAQFRVFAYTSVARCGTGTFGAMSPTEKENTMKNRYFLITLALAAAPAFAFNTSAFRDAPFTRLSEAEVKAFSAAVISALDTAPEGTTIEWKAPKTQFTSKITPGNTVNGIERICRNATIESEAKDRFQRGNYSFCKTPGGKWQLTSPGSKSGKK